MVLQLLGILQPDPLDYLLLLEQFRQLLEPCLHRELEEPLEPEVEEHRSELQQPEPFRL